MPTFGYLNRQVFLRRLLQVVAAAVSAGPLLYWIFTPTPTCPKDLVVHLDKLAVGDYELAVAGDSYVNNCQFTVGEHGALWVSCKLPTGVGIVPPYSIHFPVQLSRVTLDVRHGTETLFSETLIPRTDTWTSGCTTQKVSCTLT